MKMKSKINLFLIVLTTLFAGGGLHSQNDKLYRAQQLAQEAKFDSALICINAASVHPETSENLATWFLKGFILKELYKAKEGNDPRSKLRDEAIVSLIKSLELDKGSETKPITLQTVKYLSARYKNDAAMILGDTSRSRTKNIDFEAGIYNYNMYKKAYAYVDPSMDFTRQDVEFYIVLGDVYSGIFESDMEKNKQYFDLSKGAFEKAIALDSNDATANYHLARLYYNRAASLITQVDYGLDIVAFDNILDQSAELFKISLPYMTKAYELDPKNVNTLEGLSGIYSSLKDDEKSAKFMEEKKKLEGEK
jgi:tetratricopeptide (TPR) repeat protein